MGFLDSEGLRYLAGKIKAAIPSRLSQLTNDAGFLTEHQDLSGKLDKTATAAAATKLATARTIRTNLASTSTASFNGTANVTPGVTGVLPVANGGTGSSTEKYLPLAGGTITGNLTLKGSSNYGTQINLGDGDYVHLSEPADDCLEIKAKKVNFVLSDTSASKLTVNGSPLSGGGGLENVANPIIKTASAETTTVTLEADGLYFIAMTSNKYQGGSVFVPMEKLGSMESMDIYCDWELSGSSVRADTFIWLEKVDSTTLKLHAISRSISNLTCYFYIYKLG